MSNIDFDINSYSINEIYNTLGVDKNSSIDYIKNICDDKKDNAKNVIEGEELNNVIKFIDDCYKIIYSLKSDLSVNSDRSLERIVPLPPPQILPVNYSDNIQFVNKINESNYRINPITPNTINQIICIDSTFRDNPDKSTNSNFVFTMPNIISNVINMKIVQAELPNTHYFISKEMTLSISVKYLSTEYNYNIIIPDGTWTSDDILNLIQNYFDTYTDTSDPSNVYIRYLNISLIEQTGKIIIRFKTHQEICDLNTKYSYTLDETILPDLQYKLVWTTNIIDIQPTMCYNAGYQGSKVKEAYDSDCNLLYILGFSYLQVNNYISYNNTNYFYYISNLVFQGALIANYIYAHTFDTYYYICIDDFIVNTKDQIMAFKNKSIIGNNILARIQVDANPFETNISNSRISVFKERNYFGNVKIQKLGVKIIDKYGNIVDFNNSSVSLAIQLTQSYSSENQKMFNSINI